MHKVTINISGYNTKTVQETNRKVRNKKPRKEDQRKQTEHK